MNRNTHRAAPAVRRVKPKAAGAPRHASPATAAQKHLTSPLPPTRWRPAYTTAQLKKLLAKPDPTTEELLAAASRFPKEALAHPVTALLPLSDPKAWFVLRWTASYPGLNARLKRALPKLREVQKRQLALAVLERQVLPVCDQEGLGQQARRLAELLGQRLREERSREAISAEVLLLGLTHLQDAGKALAVHALRQVTLAMLTRADQRREWEAFYEARPRLGGPRFEREMPPRWTVGGFVHQAWLLVSQVPAQGEEDDETDPKAGFEELGWQTEAAEALLAGQPIPERWTAPA